MDCTAHGVAKSWTRLSDLHFHFTFNWSACVLLYIFVVFVEGKESLFSVFIYFSFGFDFLFYQLSSCYSTALYFYV